MKSVNSVAVKSSNISTRRAKRC